MPRMASGRNIWTARLAVPHLGTGSRRSRRDACNSSQLVRECRSAGCQAAGVTEQTGSLGGSAPAALNGRSFTAWPAWVDLSLDVVQYGPDIATEAELRLLGKLDNKRVLELGCGGGPNSVAMAKQGARVIAVDDSEEQVAHARRLAEREETKLELRHGDLADLAFVRADTIDVALSVYTLTTIADLDRVFRQVHRVLRP